MDKLHDIQSSLDIVLSIPGETKEEAEESLLLLSTEEILIIALMQLVTPEPGGQESDSVH